MDLEASPSVDRVTAESESFDGVDRVDLLGVSDFGFVSCFLAAAGDGDLEIAADLEVERLALVERLAAVGVSTLEVAVAGFSTGSGTNGVFCTFGVFVGAGGFSVGVDGVCTFVFGVCAVEDGFSDVFCTSVFVGCTVAVGI